MESMQGSRDGWIELRELAEHVHAQLWAMAEILKLSVDAKRIRPEALYFLSRLSTTCLASLGSVTEQLAARCEMGERS